MSNIDPTNSTDPPSEDLVERILEDYLAQVSRGKCPDIEAYCRDYPQCADELREIARTMDPRKYFGVHRIGCRAHRA